MGRVSGCVPRRRCREQKGEKKKKYPSSGTALARLRSLKLLWIQPSYRAVIGKKCLSKLWNAAYQDALRLTVITCVLLGWNNGKKIKIKTAEKPLSIGSHQWRVLIREDFEIFSEPEKTPFFLQSETGNSQRIYTGRSNCTIAAHGYTISYNREEGNRSKSKFREYYYSASSLENTQQILEWIQQWCPASLATRWTWNKTAIRLHQEKGEGENSRLKCRGKCILNK